MKASHRRRDDLSFRIEIKFAGEAPSDELARAKILGSKDVHDAIVALQAHLEALGLPTVVSAQSVRSNERRPRQALAAE